MIKFENDIFPFYCFRNLLAEDDILHFISSGDDKKKRNLNLNTSEQLSNRILLSQSVGFNIQQLTVGQQTHSSNIRIVEKGDMGRGGKDNESRFPDTDAMITGENNVCLMVMTADCVPLLLYDRKQRVIAAVHAGWRGTVAQIVVKTIQLMITHFGSSVENILVGIGPSIGKCCFEVGKEVADAFRLNLSGIDDCIIEESGKLKYKIDLGEVNRRQLLNIGVHSEHIEMSGICTVCNHLDFFSYRHSAGDTGRLGTGIMLRE